MSQSLVVCVDLDGTLIYDDVSWMTFRRCITYRPYLFFKFIGLYFKGLPCLKKEAAQLSKIDPRSLRYNPKVLDYIQDAKKLDRKVYLVTASHQLMADAVADHLNIFDDAYGSKGSVNLAGKHKAAFLAEKFGHKGFIYLGNSKADYFVWEKAAQAIVVNCPEKLYENLDHPEKIYLPD